MLSAPSLHAAHMFRTSEVILVFGLLKPSTLAVGLAGLAALLLATVVLPILVARVWDKQPMAMTAFFAFAPWHWSRPSCQSLWQKQPLMKMPVTKRKMIE
jgi:hypothetical protein